MTLFSGKMDDSFDEVQARKTALLFLCRINADYHEVERFLMSYPDSLLFENIDTGNCIQYTVMEQMRQCNCFVPACNENRQRILELLNKGFQHYNKGTTFNNKDIMEKYFKQEKLETFFQQLQLLERDIKGIWSRKLSIRAHLLEAQVRLRASRMDLESFSRKESMNKLIKK